MKQTCEYNDCGNGDRKIYCPAAAADPKGSADVIINQLDELLYERPTISDESYNLHDNIVTRSFRFIEACTSGSFWPVVETSLEVEQYLGVRSLAEKYRVRLGWRVLLEELEFPEEFVTEYNIERYPFGQVQASLEQPDLREGRRITSLMTEYDYTILFDALCKVEDWHNLELADNRRSAAAQENF